MSEKANSENIRSNLNRLLKPMAVILIAILVLLGLIRLLIKPCDPSDRTYREVFVPQNASVQDVSAILQEKGIITSSRKFNAVTKVLLLEKHLHPGTYFLTPSDNMVMIANTLKNGISSQNGFTIPAGYTVDQIAEALDQAGYVDGDEFLKVAAETDFGMFAFLDSDRHDASQLEGYLLPETYTINQSADETMIITMMLNEFDNFFTDEYIAKATELGYTVDDIVIYASVIEKETSVDKEKSKLAAVIYNRLDAGMQLQGGTPDKPICCPSKESIEAVLDPAKIDALYYVQNSDLKGSHKFCKTRAEYNELKDKYNEALKESKQEQ